MSIEVAFGSAIDAEYKRIVVDPDDKRFRVITLSKAGGGSLMKDPVYEKLRDREDFTVRLHELPLYVLRRSLLVEDETLFHRAKRLYKTRNKIVHAGKIDNSRGGEHYTFEMSLTRNDALNTAIKIFSWLGMRANFILPTKHFLSLSERTKGVKEDSSA